MNRAELITRVSEKTGQKKKDTEIALDAILSTIEEALVEGENVKLIGFGTFETRDRKERTGRNPQKPETIVAIPASKAPVFKAGKSLKDAVNGK